jgi:hypothetical protein
MVNQLAPAQKMVKAYHLPLVNLWALDQLELEHHLPQALDQLPEER